MPGSYGSPPTYFGGPSPYGSPQGVAPPHQSGGSRLAKALFTALLVFLVAVGGGMIGSLLVNQEGTPVPGDAVSGSDVSRTGGELDLPAMAERAKPTVVSIGVQTATQQGTGSGIVVSRDGLVLTNNHVVGDADEIEVRFHDGSAQSGEVVASDPSLDLAVVRIRGAGSLKAADLGDSARLRVGDTVVAIGSPLGLEGSVTSGIVSGLDRTIPAREDSGGSKIRGVIQTDAAINPGNSGGPLLNAAGEVIGINTAIATTSDQGGNIGLGFAVPVNAAKDLLSEAGK